MGDFPSQVQVYEAIGVAGDFASANPRASLMAGAAALIAGAAGCAVGLFAWVDATGQTAQNFAPPGGGAPAGFVHREQQALITVFLANASLIVPTGYPVVLHVEGDFLVKNSGTNVATPGMKAYANYSTGAITFAASGSPPSGGSGSASSIAATNGSVTASIAVVTSNSAPDMGQLTVTAVGSGSLVPGSILSGTGVQSGTQVVSQLSGTTGGIGVYEVNIPQTTASTTVTAAAGTLTVGGTVTGAFGIGDVLSGTDVVAGTVLTGLGTGTGGAGTYYVNNNTAVTSTAISATSAVETKWYLGGTTPVQPGALARMTSWPQG